MSRRQIHSGASSEVGTKYGGLNQDTFINKTFDNPVECHGQNRVHLWGVFDGHSMLGEYAAIVAGKAFVDFFEKVVRESWSNDKAVFISDNIVNDAFDYAHNKIQDFYSMAPSQYTYPVRGKQTPFVLDQQRQVYKCTKFREERAVDFGCTAVIAILVNDRLVVASSGDSMCLIGGKEAPTEFLNVAHSCLNPEEIQRIETNYPQTKFTPDGQCLMVHDSNGRSMLINMTRALGHKHLGAFGVTHKPSITVRTLTKADASLIIASDGVWDTLTEREAIQIVEGSRRASSDPHTASVLLIEKALAAVPEGELQDNTTAVVVFL